jgi:hypothetical protein
MENGRDQQLTNAIRDLRKGLQLDPSPDATHAVVGRFLRAVFPSAQVIDRGGQVVFIARSGPVAAESAHLEGLARRAMHLARGISELTRAFRVSVQSSTPIAPSIDVQLEAAKRLMDAWEANFASPAAALRDELASASLTDPELDEHYERPVNALGLELIALRFELIARRIERHG